MENGWKDSFKTGAGVMKGTQVLQEETSGIS